MKFIFSYIKLGNEMPNLNLAKISNFLIQKHGFKTVFFGDIESLNFLKSVRFDETYEIKKEEIENIPKCIWSMSKFIAMSKMNEPFLHVDFDFLFFKLDKSRINKNILCLHSENIIVDCVKYLQKLIHIHPKNINNIENISYNCAIIGGTNFKFLNKISNEIIKYVSDNKSFINTIYTNNLNNKNINIKLIPVLVEQVWMFEIFKFYKEKFYTYLSSDLGEKEFQQEFYEKGILHLQGAEELKAVKFTLDEFVNNFKLN